MPGYTGAQMYLSIEADSEAMPPANREYSLMLEFVPVGITGAPPIGTTWTIPLNKPLTIAVPTYSNSDGEKGYRFALTMSEVAPEPASLAILATWMTLALPRRRR